MLKYSPNILLLLACLTVFNALPGQSYPDSKRIDSLYIQLKSATGEARALQELEIAKYYFPFTMDSVLNYTRQLERYLVTHENIFLEAYVKKFRSFEAENDLDTEKALLLAKESFELFSSLDMEVELGWITYAMARCFMQEGDYLSAIKFNSQALEFFKDAGNDAGLAEAYNGLGRINYQLGKLESAEESFQHALDLLLKEGKTREVYRIYNNLGIVNMDLENTEKALGFLWKAARGFENSGNNRSLALTFGNIGIVYDSKLMHDSAIFYARKALMLAEKSEFHYGIITGTINLGAFLRMEEKYDSSQIYLESALEMATATHLMSLEQSVYEELEFLWKEKGDYRKAYGFRTMVDSLQELTISEDSRNELEDLNFSTRYNAEFDEISSLREHQKTQKIWNTALFVTIIIFALMVAIMIYAYQLIQHKNKIMGEANRLLEDYNHKLKFSENELTTVIDDKNKLFSIIAHDLRNPLASITGFAELLEKRFDELDGNEKKEYISNILQESKSSLELLENLLLWARAQLNQLELKKENVIVSELINVSIEPLKRILDKKDLDLQVDIWDDFELEVDFEMIKLVLRNIVMNAIKFSFPSNPIILRARNLDGFHCIQVIDKGTGMESSKLDSLFSSSQLTTSKGTMNESGSGLGLLISHEYTVKNGGTIKVESSIGHGSTFSICFPL